MNVTFWHSGSKHSNKRHVQSQKQVKILSHNGHKSEMTILAKNTETPETLKKRFTLHVSAKRQAPNAKKTEQQRRELNVKPLGPINVTDL